MAAGAPRPPISLTATAISPTKIELSWTAPGQNNGAAVTGYRIEVSSDGGANWSDLAADTGSTGTTYSHTSLSAGSTRDYRVSAINSQGAGAASNVASATTDVPVTDVTLVDNMVEPNTDSGLLSSFDQAQQFTTGPHPSGYTLTSVAFQMGQPIFLGDMTVTIRETDRSNEPGTIVVTVQT